MIVDSREVVVADIEHPNLWRVTFCICVGAVFRYNTCSPYISAKFVDYVAHNCKLDIEFFVKHHTLDYIIEQYPCNICNQYCCVNCVRRLSVELHTFAYFLTKLPATN